MLRNIIFKYQINLLPLNDKIKHRHKGHYHRHLGLCVSVLVCIANIMVRGVWVEWYYVCMNTRSDPKNVLVYMCVHVCMYVCVCVSENVVLSVEIHAQLKQARFITEAPGVQPP